MFRLRIYYIFKQAFREYPASSGFENNKIESEIYVIINLEQAPKITSLFSLNDHNTLPSNAVYKRKCSCDENHIEKTPEKPTVFSCYFQLERLRETIQE